MKNFLIAFSVFLVWSVFGLWLYSWMNDDKETSLSKLNIPKSEVIEGSELDANDSLNMVMDEKQEPIDTNDELVDKSDENGLRAINIQGDYIFLYTEGIKTQMNSSEILIPPSLVDFKYKLYTYLIEHPKEVLHINSIYSPAENIVSPNLGIQRGEKLKAILNDIGVPKDRMVIKPIIKSINSKENDWTNNIMYFTFKQIRVTDKIDLKTSTSRTVYPDYSGTDILVNDDLKSLLVEVSNKLKNNSDTKVEIVGHTDNVGNGIDNYRLGLKHARQVRWYLINKGGFDPEQIMASSKGEDEPITIENENQVTLLNRRIEVIYH